MKCLVVYIMMGSVFMSGCDVIYRMLDKEGAEERELVGEILPFEENPAIKEVQGLLKLYGYHVGKVDGVLGGRTRDAIEKFQEDNGLIMSRFVDQKTWAKMCVFKDNDLVVDRRLNGRLIQEILIAAGQNPGKIDGKMGPQTIRAIVEFQKEKGLKADGKVGYKTLTALAEYLSP